jgi:hypothetical protein
MSLAKLSEINPENIREVSVPLEISQIKEFFENKELFFIIDYAKSKIKGSMFLTYISNLELPSEIYFGSASKAEKFEILKIFLETRNLCTSDVLRFTAAQVLLVYRKLNAASVISNPLLTTEDCEEFIAQNAELMKRWNTFIESSMIYTLTSFKELDDAYQFSTSFEVIDDANYVGNNVVQLFSVPNFMETFFSVPAMGPNYFFKAQFREYMFKGKNMFEYFYCPENSIVGIFTGLLEGTVGAEDFEKLKGIEI